MRVNIFLFLFLLLFSLAAWSQPAHRMIEVRVVPVSKIWEVTAGDDIYFDISVLRDGHFMESKELSYRYGPEKMAAEKSASVEYKGGVFRVKAGKAGKPGFITCEAWIDVDGKKYSGLANVAVDPHKITAVAQMPVDFEEFWNGEKAAVKELPLAPKLELLSERCTSLSNVYHVSFVNHKANSRIYGILSVPKVKGKYPAILNVPGAGIRPYDGDTYLSDDGFISLTIGIHGIPVNLNREVYNALAAGGLDQYWMQNLDDRKAYYYRRVYMGLIRAIDFIHGLPEFDGFLAVSGGSQGGALAVVAAALDERVDCYTSFYPALCDLTGYLHGRAAGWPAMFKEQKPTDKGVDVKASVSAYYDVANFARIVRVPGFFSWGYNDTVCPPTSMYAAYNAIVAPKELAVYPQTAHWNYPEQWEKKQAFIKKMAYTQKY